jgi:hypothetical protein
VRDMQSESNNDDSFTVFRRRSHSEMLVER